MPSPVPSFNVLVPIPLVGKIVVKFSTLFKSNLLILAVIHFFGFSIRLFVKATCFGNYILTWNIMNSPHPIMSTNLLTHLDLTEKLPNSPPVPSSAVNVAVLLQKESH